MRILGVPPAFSPTGSANYLLDEYGMSPEGIERAAGELLSRKGAGLAGIA
jgi:transketolase